MKNIKSFNEYINRSYVWEPIRIPSEERYMPDDENKKLYQKSVIEEISEILKTVYELSDKEIIKIQKDIWSKYFKDWKHILVDSMVNWDTPSQCAQKIINVIKTNFNLT